MSEQFFFSRLLYGMALCLTIGLSSHCCAQPLSTTVWEENFGGPKNDEAFSIVQTADGGYVVAGYTGNTVEAGLPDYHGGFEDGWVLKLDSLGNEAWEKCLGGSAQEEANSIVQTRDGGYCVAIRTESWDGDVTGYHGGGSDAWIVRLTPDHKILWEHNIGGSNWDDPLSIIQTSDGGFAFVGYTRSDDGDVYGHFGGDSIQNDDAWIVRLNDSGAIEWQKCLGGLGMDWATGVVQTKDGGYALCGMTNSTDGDVSGNHGGPLDAWVVRLDSIGNIQWQRCLGGDSTDWASSIALTSDSGFIVAGATASNNNGDVSGYHGDTDAWVIKLSSSGALQWQKCLGGSREDLAWSVIQTSDGGYAIAGQTTSNDGDAFGNHGGKGGDAWLVKLSNSGKLQWQRCFGGSLTDIAFSIIQTRDGDFTFGGMSMSSNGDVAFNEGNEDMLVAKLKPPAPSAVIPTEDNSLATINLYPNPANAVLLGSLGSVASGASGQFNVQNMLGQTVMHGSLAATFGGLNWELNVQNLAQGAYILTVSVGSIFRAIPFEIIHR